MGWNVSGINNTNTIKSFLGFTTRFVLTYLLKRKLNNIGLSTHMTPWDDDKLEQDTGLPTNLFGSPFLCLIMKMMYVVMVVVC